MKILFLSELFYPHGGGAELATHLYAKLLSKEGFDVAVVTNKFNGETDTSKRQNLVIYRLPLFKGEESTKYSILRKLDVLFSSFMKKQIITADVIYVPRFWYSAVPLAKLYRKPVVVHLHDYIPVCPLSNLYNAFSGKTCSGSNMLCLGRCIYAWEKMRGRKSFETISSVLLNSTLATLWRKSIKLCDAIICVSDKHREIVMKADASLKTKIHTIYNPLPNMSYEDFEGDDFGYFGGPNYLKGFHVLYKAVKRIIHDDNRIKVHATNFSNSFSSFAETIRGSGFKLYGRLEEKQFSKLYRQIRCVIVPSIWQETFSYTVVEALLGGRLVIASEIGAIPEVASGCDSVFLFSPGCFEELAEKLLSIKAMNRETIVELGIRSRRNIKRKFRDKKTIGEFVRLLTIISENTN